MNRMQPTSTDKLYFLIENLIFFDVCDNVNKEVISQQEKKIYNKIDTDICFLISTEIEQKIIIETKIDVRDVISDEMYGSIKTQ